MRDRLRPLNWRRLWPLLFAGLGLIVLASRPFERQVVIVPRDWQTGQAYPRFQLLTPGARTGERARIAATDTVPWAYLKLEVNGRSAQLQSTEPDLQTGTWTWVWEYTVPEAVGYSVSLFFDCHTGCQERARVFFGQQTTAPSRPASTLRPTKLGLAFTSPERDWHGRSGWALELAYALSAEQDYWGVDDLSERVRFWVDRGQRVLVRVDYAQGQPLPPRDDQRALDEYLSYLRRLARDVRLQGVYGYVIGAGLNLPGSGEDALARAATPDWSARIINGFGLQPARTDHAVGVVRAENSQAHVIVGTVRPWVEGLDGAQVVNARAPWLNYFNTLAAHLEYAALEKQAAGLSDATPDGFALAASGRIATAVAMGRTPSEEPIMDMATPAWGGAQAGFQVYRDWMTVLRGYPTLASQPLYLTAVNTFVPDGTETPADNYPAGWLSTALVEIETQSQVAALIWFSDTSPTDAQWQYFALTFPKGNLVDAAREFEQLLQR